jgi:hypothetical protein
MKTNQCYVGFPPIHEVRPWSDLDVTVGQLKLAKDLKLIDFSETSDSEQFP